MFKEKRFIYKFSEGLGAQFEDDKKRQKSEKKGVIESSLEEGRRIIERNNASEVILDTFINSILEKGDEGFTIFIKKETSILPILKFLDNKFEKIVHEKLKLGFAFEGFNESGMIWLWEKNGEKIKELNPIFIDDEVKQILNPKGNKLLHEAKKQIDSSNFIEATFNKIISEMKQKGLIAHKEIRNTDLGKDLLAVVDMMYRHGKYNNKSIKSSYNILVDPDGVIFELIDKKLRRKGFKSIKFRMDEYDSWFQYKPITNENQEYTEPVMAKTKEERDAFSDKIFPGVKANIKSLWKEYETRLENGIRDEEFDKYKGRLYEELENILNENDNVGGLVEGLKNKFDDIESKINQGTINTKEQLLSNTKKYFVEFHEKAKEIFNKSREDREAVDLIIEGVFIELQAACISLIKYKSK